MSKALQTTMVVASIPRAMGGGAEKLRRYMNRIPNYNYSHNC